MLMCDTLSEYFVSIQQLQSSQLGESVRTARVPSEATPQQKLAVLDGGDIRTIHNEAS